MCRQSRHSQITTSILRAISRGEMGNSSWIGDNESLSVLLHWKEDWLWRGSFEDDEGKLEFVHTEVSSTLSFRKVCA